MDWRFHWGQKMVGAEILTRRELQKQEDHRIEHINGNYRGTAEGQALFYGSD